MSKKKKDKGWLRVKPQYDLSRPFEDRPVDKPVAMPQEVSTKDPTVNMGPFYEVMARLDNLERWQASATQQLRDQARELAILRPKDSGV